MFGKDQGLNVENDKIAFDIVSDNFMVCFSFAKKKKTYLLMRKKFQKHSFFTNGLLLNVYFLLYCVTFVARK